jgi:pyridoxal-phosphate dependent TrpB-like enzyme
MKTKVFLDESDIPTHWYNIVADLPTPPAPHLHPGTKEPLAPEDMLAIFPMGLIEQEASGERWIEIPDAVQEIYRLWRPSPLHRARRLEAALGTTARIYYKYEGESPVGSHKTNSSVPQAYYNKLAGKTRLTTETGAGQWGAALAFATQVFGMTCDVFQVRNTYDAKPYRRMLMQTYGASVTPSPSDTTEAGRQLQARFPGTTGSLGMAISEAIELAVQDPNASYALGSVLNHVCLHQTVIGQETLKQLAVFGEDLPDYLFACAGGGSNLAGLSFPFIRQNLAGKAKVDIVCLRAGGRAVAHAGRVPLRLRGQLRHDAAAQDVHAGQRLRSRPRARRRPALPRHVAARVALLPRGTPPRDRRQAAGRLRRRRPVRPRRGHRPGVGVLPRDRGRRPAGQGGDRGRRVSRHPHRSLRLRPARPAGLRRVPDG